MSRGGRALRATPAWHADRAKSTAALLVFSLLFVTLTVSSFTTKSATWDEPAHLTCGYWNLAFGDYRFSPDHPPFARTWAALPLLFMKGIRTPDPGVDRLSPQEWFPYTQDRFSLHFLYRVNDADRLLYAARFMTVLLGLVLGSLLFAWGRALLGFPAACAVLAAYAFEPNILAHSSLVTTDLAATCFLFGTAYFLWRTTRLLSVPNLAGALLFFSLGIITKHSLIFAVPLAALLLALRVADGSAWTTTFVRSGPLSGRRRQAGAAAILFLLLIVAGCLSVWAIYRFRYEPSPSPGWIYRTGDFTAIAGRVPLLARVAEEVDRRHLLPNAYIQGLLINRGSTGQRTSFLAGRFSDKGWWYYFPVAFLVKTPVSAVLLILGGLALVCFRRAGPLRDWLFVLLPAAGYLGGALLSPLNIGLRHILPAYPFLLLAAGAALAWLRWRGRLLPLAALALIALETLAVHPHELAFFNVAAGGPENGWRILADSNVDWGQDLKPLARWVRENRAGRIGLAYFGTADPDYYGMDFTPLPGGPAFLNDRVGPPQLPGYVAVSVNLLQGIYLTEVGRRFYAPLRARTPAAAIGHSIRVFWVDAPWWEGSP